MNFFDFMQGFLIGSSLIIAIGPQNLFVIQQGLKNKYIFITVLICSLSDALLIIVGITLSSILINIQPTILFVFAERLLIKYIRLANYFLK